MSTLAQQARTALIAEVIALEWDFFQETQNKGGRASCQENPEVFKVMRSSQFLTWSDATIQSYLRDLQHDKEVGINPVVCKYAYMMRSTHPDEFAALEESLPPIGEDKLVFIESITNTNLLWEEECDRLFPHVRNLGRPLRSSQDSAMVTSFETYLRGELATYSLQTLKLLHDDIQKALAAGRNLAKENLDAQAKGYGYSSIEELERSKQR